MTIGLTILLGLLSLGILAGRVYEILKLTDLETGFYIYRGIVFNPYILIIFIIITVCCGVIIFGDNKKVQPFFSESSKIIAAASGAMFAIYGVMAISSGTPLAFFIIAGGISLVLTGIFGLKSAKNAVNIIVIVLSVIFISGLCLDVIIFNVSTIYNVSFTKNVLTYIFTAVFLLYMMKNVFYPSQNSKMLLYITGIMAFVFCGIMNIADIIVMVIDGQAVLPNLFFHTGFAFFGLFAFDNAISAMPNKKSKEDKADLSADTDSDANTVAETDMITDTVHITKLIEEDAAEKEIIHIQSTSQHPAAEFFEETAKENEDFSIMKNEEKNAKKVVFTAKYEAKEKVSPKDGGKVVYKKPKN